MYHPERAHWQPLMMDGLIMECFLHIHNLHHTEQRGLAGLPCTYTLSAGHVHSHSHTHICMLVCVHMYTCTGLPECIDKKGGGNNKRKGANSLLQPCHVRSIWQINPLLRRRWRSPTFYSGPLSFWDAWWHVKSDFQRCMLLRREVYSGVPGQCGWIPLYLQTRSLLSISTLHCPCLNT